jgi:hypothetical protein
MLPVVPVSRKRKKKKKKSSGSDRSSGRSRYIATQRGSGVAAPARDLPDLAQAFQGLAAYRDQVDQQRMSRAAAMATKLVADLARAMTDQPDMIVTDAVCELLGAVLAEAERTPMDEPVGPHHLAEAIPVAAEAAVMAALTATTGPADAWRAPWRVLTALACVLPHSFNEVVGETITRLRDLPAGRVLPAVPTGPDVTGPVLWTSDQHGSRFAVAAPIMTAEEPVRWYLWDIDACGHDAFTVHSGYYPSSEAALTAWQTGVGQTASAGAVLAPVDDPWLLAALLPTDMGFMRPGGESPEQFAEYHRSKRLAEAVNQAMPRLEARPHAGLTAAIAKVEFAAWLRARIPDQPEQPENLNELVEELADSWNLNGIDAVYATCSPHRVALCVLHMRNYYFDDYADQLVALLPDWTRWLATCNATAPELADRCLPYAHGRPHPQLGQDDRNVNYYGRVIE